MGVHGLASYLQDNRRTLAHSLEFPQPGKTRTPFVVDGWSFVYRLYDESRLPWVYGGEYGAFQEVIQEVVRAWIAMGCRLYFVFDGPYTPLKFRTGIARASEGIIQPSLLFFRTSPASRASPRFLRETSMLPPLCYATTIAALQSFGDALELHFADGEGDPYAVELAARLGGYVIGQDSDFVVLNVEGYAGYIPIAEMLWSTSQDDDNLSQSTSSIPAEDGFIVARSKNKANKDTTTSTHIYGIIPPDTDASLSLKCTVYTPDALATHLRLPVSLLPLLGALIGNDFTAERQPIRNLFFERNTTAPQRLLKVATTLVSVLPTSNSAKKRPKKPITSVVDIIELAVEALLVRAPSSLTSGERATIIDQTIEAALQYAIPARSEGIEPAIWPTAVCAIHLPDSCPLVESMSRRLSGANEDEGSRPFRTDVRASYVEAYRQGKLDPRILDALYTGTMWPKHFLEDPDVECIARTITRSLRQWIYSILEVGVGLPAQEDEEQTDERPDGDVEDSDEDQLIDVVEEDSDEESLSDPLAPLRGALQELNGGASAETPSRTSSTTSVPARPVFVTEYVRRGTRLAEEDVAVKPFHRLIEALGDDDGLFRDLIFSPPTMWPISARLSLFLRILGSDTPAIRALPAADLVPVVALRWVAGRLYARASEDDASRGREKEKWTQHDGQAFLFSVSSASGAAASDVPQPSITNRSVQLAAQASAAIITIEHLVQTLLLTEQAPSPAVRFSGQRFHGALASSHCNQLSPEVWSAAVDRLEHAFVVGKEKSNRKEKRARIRTGNQASPAETQQSLFSLLSSLDEA